MYFVQEAKADYSLHEIKYYLGQCYKVIIYLPTDYIYLYDQALGDW